MNDLKPRRKNCSERKSFLYVLFIVIFVILLTAIIIILKLKTFNADNICVTQECVNSSAFLLDLINSEADPCENFYNFACGNYKGNLVIQNLQNAVDTNLVNLITSPIKNDDSRSVKLQKKYYQTCMNIDAIEEDQNETLKKLFEKLGGWPVLSGEKWNETEFNWGKIVEVCKDIGFYYDWFIDLQTFEGSIYENRLFIDAPSNAKETRDSLKEKYVRLMTNIVMILEPPGNSKDISESMKKVMDFENDLAKIIEESKYNSSAMEYTMEEIQNKFPSMPWPSIFKNLLMPSDEKIIFTVTEYIPKLENLLSKTPIRTQANYIFWKLTDSFSTFLTHVLRKEFETYADLSGDYQYPTDRGDYCYGITSTTFAYVSEAEYVRKYTDELIPVQYMVDRIRFVLHDHIENAKWMSQSDKFFAFLKLKNLTVVVGGPEEMFDDISFEKILGIDQIDLSDLHNPIEIICQIDRSRDLFNLDFGKPKLTIEQAKYYQAIANLAFIKYVPDENMMFLPAAALNGLFYSRHRSNYLNYGALGTIIGHELAHGFGIMGNSELEDGEEKILWSNSTSESFLKTTECLLEDCNDGGTNSSVNVSCKNSFEENFADYTGINLSYEGFLNVQKERGIESSLPGLPYNPNKLFWIIYASIMCNNVEVNNTDRFSHMLPFQRIVGSFRNSEYFAKDFDCPVGSNMNPVKKCKVL